MDLHNTTFSQGLEAGLTHSGWLVGPTTDPSLQEAAHASHFLSQEKVEELTTLVTCGPLFAGLSPSDDLQSFLANRLHLLMDVNGSPEYELTWSAWDIGLGSRICALRASARRISGQDCGGWPTPTSNQSQAVSDDAMHKEVHRQIERGQESLLTKAYYAGWPTPRTPTGGAESAQRKQELGRTQSGGGDLQATAQMAGWGTPTSRDGKDGQAGEWLANPANNPDGTERNRFDLLPRQALITGVENTSHALTAKRGALSPVLSGWLMGYPVDWLECFLSKE